MRSELAESFEGSAGEGVGRGGARTGSTPTRARTGYFDAYLPHVLLERLMDASEVRVVTQNGTIVFVDVSGFTKLSERLARAGREGAEQIVQTINDCFTALLAEAYANGASLLKFGGDALLLWFDGEEHALRACASALAMRATLRRVGRVRAGGTSIVLRMSVGVHSGAYEMFLVGGSHREYLPAGPAVSTVVELEGNAAAGQILLSQQTARQLPPRCLGASLEAGTLLTGALLTSSWMAGESAAPSDAAVAACLPTALRAHLTAAPAQPEHRVATVSFVQFGQLDGLIAADGPEAAAESIDEVVRTAQDAADRYEICMLGSDIATDGGKLLFSAGAPRATGDEEERMLLAMRHIVDAGTRLPVRVGVNRGYVFTGEVGPPYRRTYVAMGDVTNLAARLAAKAPWGTIYATDRVLSPTRARFAQTELPPFTVKGKSRPVAAFEVGAGVRVPPAASPAGTLRPLIGRKREVEMLERWIAEAQANQGSVVELLGDRGSGKSRLLSEASKLAHGMRAIQTTCETYTQTIPYIAWRDLLRQLLGLGWDDPDELVLERLRADLADSDPELLPWLPLLAIALGAQAPSTREVDELAADARVAKLHEVVGRLLEPALSAATLVSIEHAEAMDEPSAALLDSLLERVQRSSWLVIVSRRDVVSGFASASPGVALLELGALTRADALALAEAAPEARLLTPHTIALAVERAAGNPEFLLDLLAAAASGLGDSELPESIEAAASARIDALDPGDRDLLRRAAVLGLTFRTARLAHVLTAASSQPTRETWTRLSGLIVQESDGYVRFRSPLICEAAYAGLPFALRRALHAAIGAAFERDLGTDVDADPAVLSLHFSRAGDERRTWTYALLGAEHAAARFAVADAARLYRRAIAAHRGAESTAAELAQAWEALGATLITVGETAAAEQALGAARRLYEGEPIAEARICLLRGQIAQRNELPRAVRWTRRGLRALEPVRGPEARCWRARLVAELASIRQSQSRYREAERLCREALLEGEAAEELRAQARASYTLDWALFELGRYDEVRYSARALEIYRELGDPEEEGRVLNNLGGLAYKRGRWVEAIDLYRQAGACGERAGHYADLSYTDGNVGEILADQGHVEEAASHLRRARRVWIATGHRVGAAFATMLLGRLAARSGDTEEGLALLGEALADMERFHADFYAEFARGAIAEAEALGGDPVRACALVDEQLAPKGSYVALLRRVRGIALARLGDRDTSITELVLAAQAAREREEHYDVAAALDALASLGVADPSQLRERDEILARLGIVALPKIPVPM